MVLERGRGTVPAADVIEQLAASATISHHAASADSDQYARLNVDGSDPKHLPPMHRAMSAAHSSSTSQPRTTALPDILDGSSRLAELAQASHHHPRLFASRRDVDSALPVSPEPTSGRSDIGQSCLMVRCATTLVDITQTLHVAQLLWHARSISSLHITHSQKYHKAQPLLVQLLIRQTHENLDVKTVPVRSLWCRRWFQAS